MPAYLGYPTIPAHRSENGLNAVIIANAADTSAALAAAQVGRVNGSTSEANLAAWTFSQIQAGALTLPGSASLIWLDGAHGVGASGRSF